MIHTYYHFKITHIIMVVNIYIVTIMPYTLLIKCSSIIVIVIVSTAFGIVSYLYAFD